MWVAQIAPDDINRSEGFASEAEAVAWLEAEMRAKGTRRGVVFEMEGDEG